MASDLAPASDATNAGSESCSEACKLELEPWQQEVMLSPNRGLSDYHFDGFTMHR